MNELDISALTQVAFSVLTCWYLLTNFSKKIETLSELVRETQKEAVLSAQDTKEMFGEIRDLIKETTHLVQSTSESVRIQSELTKTALDRMERISIPQMQQKD